MKVINKKILIEYINKLYNLPKILFIKSYSVLIRTRIFYIERIPEEQSAIFAINHITGADPIILLASFKKKIYFLADSKLFANKFTNFFFRKITDSIPVFKKDHLKNIRSFKDIIEMSKKKRTFFGIFPEGYLNKSERLDDFFKGCAYLSYKTKLPVIPVYIHNIFKGPTKKNWFGRNNVVEGIITLLINKFKKINIFIGNPVNPTGDIIINEFKDFFNKYSYKCIIKKINRILINEFLELEKEASGKFIENHIENKSDVINEYFTLI